MIYVLLKATGEQERPSKHETISIAISSRNTVFRAVAFGRLVGFLKYSVNTSSANAFQSPFNIFYHPNKGFYNYCFTRRLTTGKISQSQKEEHIMHQSFVSMVHLGPGNSGTFNFSNFKALVKAPLCGVKFFVKSLLKFPTFWGLAVMRNDK